jgi:hypothetical protein
MPGGRAGRVAAACALLAVLALLAWAASDWSGRGGTSPSSTTAPKAVELCGYGPTRPIRSTVDYPSAVREAAERTFAEVAADLASGSAPHSQAVGLYAMLVVAMRQAARADQQAAAECADEPCLQRRWKRAKEAAAPHAQELARRANDLRDPAAYAFALYGCRLNRDEGACAQLSIERWTQLEPGNAVAWLHLAGDAAQRKDGAALRAALLEAARAKTADSHGSLTLQMAEHPAAQALPAAPRLVYLSQLLGVYAALPSPPHAELSRACLEDRLADPMRKSLCSDLATMLTERSAALADLSLGTTIGEQAGWPIERVHRLRDEQDAFSFISQVGWTAEDVHSCRFLAQLEARTQDLSNLGEVASAKRNVAASGRSVTELAQEWRDLQRQHKGASIPHGGGQ